MQGRLTPWRRSVIISADEPQPGRPSKNRDTIRVALETRFGTLPADVEEFLRHELRESALLDAFMAACTAPTLDDFLQRLR
jgi:hypothetical protein